MVVEQIHLVRYSRSLSRSTAARSSERDERDEQELKNMNSNYRAALDPFARDSGKKFTGKELKRSMEEVDAAVLLGRRCVPSPMMVRRRRGRGSLRQWRGSEREDVRRKM